MASTNERFTEAERRWDLTALYSDLAAVKGKPLTPVEKLHLRGLLCGYSPTEIAEKLQKNSKGVETDLCATIYKYVKSFVGNDKIENWRNISEWLEEAGYKTPPPVQLPGKELLPEDCVVNVTNIHIESNNIVFLINLRIPTAPDSERSLQNLDVEDNRTN